MNRGEVGQGDRVSAILGYPIEQYLDEDARAHKIQPDADASRGWKAMALSPTIEICRALLRGERVPWTQLRPEQAQRFGLRRRVDDHRVRLDDFNDLRA